MIATDRRNDKTRPDHEAQKLNGCIFTNYIDSTGISDYSEGNNDIAKEMIETILVIEVVALLVGLYVMNQ